MHTLNTAEPRGIEPHLRDAIEAHVAGCVACQDAWRAHRQVAAMRVPDAPTDLYDRIAAAASDVPGTGQRNGRRRRRALVSGLVVIAGVATAAAYYLIDYDRPTALEPTTRANPAPADAPDTEPPVAPDSEAQALPSEVTASTSATAPDEDRAAAGQALDRSAVVVLPAPRTTDDEAVAEAAQLLHDKLVRRLADDGFAVYADEAVEQYVATGMERVAIARTFGAGTYLTIDIREDTPPNVPASVGFVFIDASNEQEIAGAGVPPQYVEEIEERVMPPLDVDLLTRMIDSVKTYQQLDAPPQPSLDERVRNFVATVTDTSLPDDERVTALASLRGAQGTVQQDFVIQSAIAIATNSDNANVRGRVWQQLAGTDNPVVVPPLLSALGNDTAEFPRREAATALAEFTDDASVRQALESAREGDPSERVREAAGVALMTRSDQDQLIRQRVLDPSSSGQERLRAVMNPFGDNRFGFGPAIAIDDEIAAALLDIAADESTPSRSLALAFLRQPPHPELAEPLLVFLSSDPDPAVRRSAAATLAPLSADPAVRAGLEAALDDSDADVRSAVRQALSTASSPAR
jgi:HEAT repeat protein